jgi:hypothetical protein
MRSRFAEICVLRNFLAYRLIPHCERLMNARRRMSTGAAMSSLFMSTTRTTVVHGFLTLAARTATPMQEIVETSTANTQNDRQ